MFYDLTYPAKTRTNLDLTNCWVVSCGGIYCHIISSIFLILRLGLNSKIEGLKFVLYCFGWLKLFRRKGDHIVDKGGVGEQHCQAIYT